MILEAVSKVVGVQLEKYRQVHSFQTIVHIEQLSKGIRRIPELLHLLNGKTTQLGRKVHIDGRDGVPDICHVVDLVQV